MASLAPRMGQEKSLNLSSPVVNASAGSRCRTPLAAKMTKLTWDNDGIDSQISLRNRTANWRWIGRSHSTRRTVAADAVILVASGDQCLGHRRRSGVVDRRHRSSFRSDDRRMGGGV